MSTKKTTAVKLLSRVVEIVFRFLCARKLARLRALNGNAKSVSSATGGWCMWTFQAVQHGKGPIAVSLTGQFI